MPYITVTIDSGTIVVLVLGNKSHQRHRRHIHAGSNFPEYLTFFVDISWSSKHLLYFICFLHHTKYTIYFWPYPGSRLRLHPEGSIRIHPHPTKHHEKKGCWFNTVKVLELLKILIQSDFTKIWVIARINTNWPMFAKIYLHSLDSRSESRRRSKEGRSRTSCCWDTTLK